MELFVGMEEVFAGTAFYQTYVVGWPPPFNSASFDVCLLLVVFLILMFIYPIIRDRILNWRRKKRELRSYQDFKKKQSRRRRH